MLCILEMAMVIACPDMKATNELLESLEQARQHSMVERVAYCESGNRNVENPVSTASGYFQFVSNTWSWVTGLEPPASAYSYSTQLEAFHTLWNNGNGSSHWEPSRYCWEHTEPWLVFDR